MPNAASDQLLEKLQRILSLARAQLWAVRMGDPEAFERLTAERERVQQELASVMSSANRGQDASTVAEESPDTTRNVRLLLFQINQVDQQCMAEGQRLRDATMKALKDTQAYLDWSRWHSRNPRPPLIDTSG
ncbi:MAG: hypothetical protein ACPLPR_00295 [Bacillota bacterium]